MGLKKTIKKIRAIFKPPKPRGSLDARAEAASQLIQRPVTKQAGSGQVSFTEETRV